MLARRAAYEVPSLLGVCYQGYHLFDNKSRYLHHKSHGTASYECASYLSTIPYPDRGRRLWAASAQALAAASG